MASNLYQNQPLLNGKFFAYNFNYFPERVDFATCASALILGFPINVIYLAKKINHLFYLISASVLPNQNPSFLICYK